MPRKTVMHKLTSEEKTRQINKENLQLKDDFLMYLKSTQKSPGTINGYNNDLLIFFTYCSENLGNKSFYKMTKRDLIKFQNWLIENGNSSARIRRIKSALSSLSNYCENILSEDEEEFRNFRSIIRKIENPVLQPVREKVVWDEEELQKILDTLINNKNYNKACFLALAMYSGRRKAELCRFKVSDFSEKNLVCDGALYKSSPIKTKGMGGGKYIPCYTLAKKFTPYLKLWLEYRKTNNIESEWLFPSIGNVNEPMSIVTVNSWAKTFSRITGKDFYMHSMRHFFTTYLSKSGIPDSVITQIIGWESSDMCKVYNDMDIDDQIGIYFKNGEINAPENKGLFK